MTVDHNDMTILLGPLEEKLQASSSHALLPVALREADVNSSALPSVELTRHDAMDQALWSTRRIGDWSNVNVALLGPLAEKTDAVVTQELKPAIVKEEPCANSNAGPRPGETIVTLLNSQALWFEKSMVVPKRANPIQPSNEESAMRNMLMLEMVKLPVAQNSTMAFVATATSCCAVNDEPRDSEKLTNMIIFAAGRLSKPNDEKNGATAVSLDIIFTSRIKIVVFGGKEPTKAIAPFRAATASTTIVRDAALLRASGPLLP